MKNRIVRSCLIFFYIVLITLGFYGLNYSTSTSEFIDGVFSKIDTSLFWIFIVNGVLGILFQSFYEIQKLLRDRSILFIDMVVENMFDIVQYLFAVPIMMLLNDHYSLLFFGSFLAYRLVLKYKETEMLSFAFVAVLYMTEYIVITDIFAVGPSMGIEIFGVFDGFIEEIIVIFQIITMFGYAGYILYNIYLQAKFHDADNTLFANFIFSLILLMFTTQLVILQYAELIRPEGFVRFYHIMLSFILYADILHTLYVVRRKS